MPVTAAVGTRPRLSDYLREVGRRRDFAIHLALSSISAQNAPARLGPLWWVVNPLFMAGIYFIVFGQILGGSRGNPHFLAFLLGGILVFRMTSAGITDSISSLIGNAKLITNIPFPRVLLPIAAVLENTIGFLVALISVFAFLIPIAGLPVNWGVALLLVVIPLHVTFVLGIGTLISPLAIRSRDVRNLVPHLVRIWLYLSPILWEISRLDGKPAWVLWLVKANPLYPFLGLYRTITMGAAFDPIHLGLAVAWTAVIAPAGLITFYRADHRLARYL